MKVLLIDDDVAMHQLIKKFINPLITLECQTSLPADPMKFSSFDLIILDLWLEHDQNSLDFLSKVQDDAPHLLDHIILLTGAGSEEIEVRTHKLGLRDFVKKPINPRVFSALVDKHLMNLKKNKTELRFGPLRLDTSHFEAFAGEEKLELTNTEFKMLKLLMESKGRIVTRERLLTEVWDMREETQTRTVDMHISALRRKLACASELLKTKRGLGYFLSENKDN